MICNNKCQTLHFIALHWTLDQASAQEFTKYIGQQSPAPLLESALARSSLHGWAQNGATTNYRITRKVPNLLNLHSFKRTGTI